jgi:biotin synthase-related radical SAM superfamily protein
VSTYVILGMGEDPELTVEGCRRAIDLGVYPFVVPIRPVAGSLMEDVLPPEREYTEGIYRRVAAYMTERGMGPDIAKAGCARCQACSGLQSVQTLLQIGPRPVEISRAV